MYLNKFYYDTLFFDLSLPRWRGPPAARVEQVEDCREGPRLKLEVEGPTCTVNTTIETEG
jgi:hypothetical protein